MASLIPPLSDKAKLEIAHIQTDRYNPLGSFEGFQDLFDLEKYPITFDQMKAYLSMLPKLELRCSYQHGIEYRLDHTGPDGKKPLLLLTLRYDMSNIKDWISILSTFLGCSDMVLLGDIHDYWLTPQTY